MKLLFNSVILVLILITTLAGCSDRGNKAGDEKITIVVEQQKTGNDTGIKPKAETGLPAQNESGRPQPVPPPTPPQVRPVPDSNSRSRPQSNGAAPDMDFREQMRRVKKSFDDLQLGTVAGILNSEGARSPFQMAQYWQTIKDKNVVMAGFINKVELKGDRFTIRVANPRQKKDRFYSVIKGTASSQPVKNISEGKFIVFEGRLSKHTFVNQNLPSRTVVFLISGTTIFRSYEKDELAILRQRGDSGL